MEYVNLVSTATKISTKIVKEILDYAIGKKFKHQVPYAFEFREEE